MKARGLLASGVHRLLGVVFLALVLFFVWGTYAVFTKKFVDYVPVTLLASRSGLSLPMRADVKIRGVIVGVVRDVATKGHGVRLTLGLYPDEVGVIPANVSARIVPKTLFGEKYVSLQVPAHPAGRSIEAGDVITESRVAIEVERVLADVYPLLRTVQPAQLNYTLSAVADALEGRGAALGENLVTLERYLRRVNPRIPALVEDLRMLSRVSDTYRGVLPEVARLLRNSVRTGRTLVSKQEKLTALFDDVAGLSSTSRDFLERNGDNIIRLGRLGQAQLPTFARYAPEYPCLLEAETRWIPHMESGWRGHELHINLETLPTQPTGYTPADDPRYGADTGPHCETLPDPPYSQANPGPQPPMSAVDDGVESGHGKFRRRTAPAFDPSAGYAGSAAEKAVVDAVAAPVMGVRPDDVPDVATLLFGPLARGTKVSLR